MSKLLSFFATIFSFLLVLYVFNRINQIENIDKFDNYRLYIFSSIGFLILSLISFFIPSKIKINLFLFFSSIFVTFYLIEFFLISLDFNNEWNQARVTNHKISEYFEKTGKEYDERSIYEYYQDKIIDDKEVVIWRSRENVLTKNDNIFFSLSGLPNKKTIYCNENGYYAEYTSDKYGFNNPNESWDFEEIEFLLLGDSFTHGACVNRPFDIASQLRINTNKNNIINLGQGGSGPLTMYATLKEYFPLNKKVNNILWIYFEGNDLTDLMFEENNNILQNYINNNDYKQDLIENKDEINKSKSNFKIKKPNIYENFFKLTTLRSFLINNFFTKKVTTEELNKFKMIMKKTKMFSIKNNSELHFIYLPSYYRFKSNNLNNINYKNYKDIINIVDDLEINIVDVNKLLFKRLDDPLNLYPFQDQGHFTENGFELVSKTIYDSLIK